MVYLGLHQRLRGHGVLDQRPARAGQVRPLAQHLPERPSSGLAVPKPAQVTGDVLERQAFRQFFVRSMTDVVAQPGDFGADRMTLRRPGRSS